MSPAATALTVMVAIVAVGTAVGFLSGSRQQMSLEEWAVGGRGFGTALVFLLMAGESQGARTRAHLTAFRAARLSVAQAHRAT